MTDTTHSDEEIISDLRRTLPQDILGAMECRGFYDCEKYLDDSMFNGIEPRLRQALAQTRADQDRISRAEEREKTIDENTSDGYHTFRELYTFRKMYNAVLFNEWATQGVHDVHKSKKHSDGELCFGGGWFVVYATTPYGQISNHYELADWDLFKCEEREVATKFDGHTPQDVLSTLKALTTQYNNTV